MSASILPLRAAIRARCAGDASLAALMGGAAVVLDEPPRGEPPLYGLFGDAETRDASTSSEAGHEHEFSIVIWAVTRIAELLDDAGLALDGHRLVALAATSVSVDRDGETNLARATVRLRAVTEVA
jgi:hypothetical protein